MANRLAGMTLSAAIIMTLWAGTVAALPPGHQELHARAIQVIVTTPDRPAGEVRSEDRATKGSVVATILASPEESEASGSPSVVRAGIEVPGSAELDLPAGYRWRVELTAENYWAASAVVEETGLPRSLRFVAFPTATVTGRLVGAGEAGGTTLGARFLRRDGKVARRGVLGNSSCVVGDDHRFECRIPAGSVDLRLEMNDRSSDVLWNLDLSANQSLDLGRVPLLATGRLAGTVIDDTESAPVDAATVRLMPSSVAKVRVAEEQRFLLAGSSGRTDDGHFELSPVQPGIYDLTIEKAGFTPARQADVRVRAGKVTSLPEPILLRQPATLEIFLTPPVPSGADVWRVQLLKRLRSGGVELIDSIIPEVDPGGGWLANGLEPGAYRIHVGTERSPRWIEDDVTLEPGLNMVNLDVGGVPIEGHLSAGDEPVEGSIWFGGRSGETSVRVEADRHGRFEGVLPREGDWPLDISRRGDSGVQRLSPVEVRRQADGGPVSIEIALPDTALQGLVVDDAGRAVPDAIVEVLNSEERRLEATIESDAQGEFEIVGLEPGSFSVEASSGDRRSQAEQVDLDEGEELPKVKLVLAGEKIVNGIVLGDSRPVPGARILGIPSLAKPGPVPVVSVVTGADGRFTTKIPGDAVGLRVLVQAPGFGLRPMTWTVLPEHGDVRIDLSSVHGVLRLFAGGESSLDGALLDYEGTSFPVQLYRQLGGSMSGGPGTGSDRELVLGNMPSGMYTLCLPGGSESRCTSELLPPDGLASLGVEADEGESEVEDP